VLKQDLEGPIDAVRKQPVFKLTSFIAPPLSYDANTHYGLESLIDQ